MPGARNRDFRIGDSAELLAELIINSMAFTTRVPRQEDVGYDLLCVLAGLDNRLLKAGPFFTVQVKGTHENIIFEKDYEVAWIKQQENPFFICDANRDALSVEIFSTWIMHLGFLSMGADKIVLAPGGAEDNYQEVQNP